MRQKLHDPLSASGLLSLCIFEKKLFVVERWYAQYSLNTNLQANSTSINLKFCVLSPTPIYPIMNIVPPGVGPAQPAFCSYQSFFSDTPFKRLMRCFESVRSANCIWLGL